MTAITAGTLVGMYVIDLVGKDGIDPFAVAGLTLCGAALAVAGAQLFERRDVLAR